MQTFMVHQALANVSIFTHLSERLLADLRTAMTEELFETDEEVFSQGDAGFAFYVILEGEVTIVRTEPRKQEEEAGAEHGEKANGTTPEAEGKAEGRAMMPEGKAAVPKGEAKGAPSPPPPPPPPPEDVTFELVRLSQGAFFGERALLKHEPRFATVKALSKLRLLSITREAFEAVLGPLEELIPTDPWAPAPTKEELDAHHEAIEAMADAMASSIRGNMIMVEQLFKEWDEDGSGLIDRSEFVRAMRHLGIEGSRVREGCSALFDRLDDDGSGELAYEELEEKLERASVVREEELKTNALLARANEVTKSRGRRNSRD